ncbi:MAG: sulfur carrier protein ThiS [Thermoanaerobaculia bacterium]
MTQGTTIAVQVNGADREVPAEVTVHELVKLLGFEEELVAVELNQELVRRTELASRSVSAGDRIEIVEFVGGG